MSFSRLVVGAVERRSPLPPGRYWVDVFEQDQEAFRDWLRTHAAALRVLSTSSHPADDGGPARDWYLFEVHSPGVPWEGPGLPTIAPAHVKTSDDTVQKPDPEPGLLDQLHEGVQSYGATLKRTAVVVAVLGGGALLLFARRGR